MERVEEQQAAAPMIARLHGNPNAPFEFSTATI